MSLSPLTSEQIDKLVAELKANLGEIRILNDVIMKHLLGEPGKAEERLCDFINAIRKQTEQTPIVKVSIEHATNFPDSPDGKITFLDIKAKDELGVWYNIEVQLVPRGYFISRVIYYNAKVHGSQLAKGEGYENIRPTISIILTDFVLFKDLPGAFQAFRLVSDTNSGYVLSDDLQFYFIQLGEEMTQDSLTGLVKELTDWIQFLNFPRTNEATMKKVLFANPMLARTGNAISEFVADAPTRHYVEDMEMHRRDYAWAMKCERREGIAEGEARGKAEGVVIGDARGEVRGILKAKFGAIPKLLSDRLLQIADLVVLQSLASAATECQSLAEFEESLR